MRRWMPIMVALLATGAASAQDLLRDADRDVLNGLVFQARPAMKVTATRSIPPEFAAVKLPAELSLVGTATRGDGTNLTSFTTALRAAPALDMLLGALAEDGWEVETPQQVGPPPTFSAPSQTQSRTICRNGERRSVLVRDVDGQRLATIVGGPNPRPRPCHAPDPRQATMGPLAFEALNRLMPRFTFPEGVRVAMGGGSSGSNDFRRTGTKVFSTEETASSLALELSRQLTAQGWTRDAAWNGAWGAGFNWKRDSDAGPLVGLLEIFNSGADAYEVNFTLLLSQ